MISLFMHGGPSHVDLFDPKPELTKRSGENYTGEIVYSFIDRASKKLFGSPWKFRKHGQCGMDVSELLPHFAEASWMTSRHPLHAHGHQRSRAVHLVHEHRARRSRAGPALGSWLTYGLGSESQNLPAYVVLTDPAGTRWTACATGPTAGCRRCFRERSCARPSRAF